METSIRIFDELKIKVKWLYSQLKLNKYEKHKGRKLSIPIAEILSLALFKQKQNIKTKKSLFEIFNLKCSYKTLVVNLNRFSLLALMILLIILKVNQRQSSVVKHSDSTCLPVCLVKNGRRHRTMRILSSWSKTWQGWFYGLKLHITTDLNKKILSIKFSSGNVHDSKVFSSLNKDLNGIFVCDSGYLSEKVKNEFDEEDKRLLIAMTRKNQKKIITSFQHELLKTRMLIETNFRSLKQFYGIVTSLPRSIDGYFSHYIYSLLSYLIA